MSLAINCDSCGKGIAAEELENGSALEHEGTHYCERCKVPILTFLRKARAAGPASGKSAARSHDPLSEVEDLRSPPERAPARPSGSSRPEDLDLEGDGDLD